MSSPKKCVRVDRHGHIYQFKESEVRISNKQYPKGAIEIEKPEFNRNMAAHLLLRVVDSGHLNWYRTRKLLIGWKEDCHE
ncbi:MAG: hypothetical protein GWP10_15545 [Nitrospiraceae bacterium]|nr:hypothetical protein [Nitrospiraceae bacterium]